MITLNPCYPRQRGATLIVAMVMLVMMSILAVSAINLSTVNFKIVGNMQAQKLVDAAAQDALEQALSSYTVFSAPAPSTFATPLGNVEVSEAVCISSNVAKGYTAVISGIIPQDNIWAISATYTDPVTSATTTIHQGIGIRMPAGNCPEPP